MKLVRNTGTERVIDLIRPKLTPGTQLDVVTPTFSLFAFGEMLREVSALAQCRLLLPPASAELTVLGMDADRAARNRLQTRWLANRLSQWLQGKTEVRRALGAIPQGAFVLRDRDSHPRQVLLGSLAFSTDGLGLTPGNPLSLIQASETPEEASLLSQWFDAQWSGLKADPGAKSALIAFMQSLAAHRDPFLAYTLTLPEPFAAQLSQVKEILRKLAGRLEIKNADDRKQVRTRQAVLHGADFRALWDRIKHKTTYRVQFDNEALLATCIKAIKDAPPIAKTRLQWRKADLAIGRSGVDTKETASSAPVTLDEGDIELPDILTDLQDKTQLTRRSIQRILVDSGRLDDFKRNPQQFIELAAEIINRAKRLALVDGIKYQRIGTEDYYAQQLFETEELSGYLKSMIDANKSVHEQVIYQSDTERTFAEQLEKNEAIKVYAKLPGWFRVPTPLGPYNPDWAVLVEKDGAERLYFVVETKSSLFPDDLRDKEDVKIECGKAHFKALAVEESPAQYVVARTLTDLLVTN